MNPSDLITSMRSCLATSLKKIRASRGAARLFTRAESALVAENYKFASSLLRRVIRTRNAPEAAYARANLQLGEIASIGEILYQEALDEEVAADRLLKLRELCREFGLHKDLSARIRAQITPLMATNND